MKIALLTDGIWPYVIGGMQKHSFQLCKYLLLSGIDVDLYYTGPESGNTKHLYQAFNETDGVLTCKYIPSPASRYFPGHYFWERFVYSRRIFDLLSSSEVKYDFIYAQGLSGWFTILNKTKLKQRVPILSNFHGLNIFQRPINRRGKFEQIFFKRFIKKIIRKADFVQSLGGQLTQILLKEGVPRHRIIEIGIGIEKDWIVETPIEKPWASLRTFTFIGRNDWVKGISDLNKALQQINSLHTFQFRFVGPIPENESIRGGQVMYYGVVAEEKEMKKILDDTDFLVLPSYSEGMPTVILEAMSRGCAVIATDVGAVTEMVSKRNGILVKPGHVSGLVNAITAAIHLPPVELDEMKRVAVAVVKGRFEWQIVVDKLIDFFSEHTKDAVQT